LGSFERWADNVHKLQHTHAEKARQHDLIERVVSRMMHQVMTGAFKQWCENGLKSARAREVICRIILRMQNRLLSAALGRWADNVTALKAEWTEEERKQLIVHGIVRRMLNAALVGALARWCLNVQERASMAAKARKMMTKWMHTAVVLHLDAWCEHSIEETHKRLLMKRIVMRMSGNLRLGSFERWADNVHKLQHTHAEKARQHDLIERVVSRMMHQVMAGAFKQWCENGLKSARAREVICRHWILQRIIKRILNETILSALQMWHVIIVAEKIDGL